MIKYLLLLDGIAKGTRMARLRIANKAEREIADRLTKDGWRVIKRGWPDFLAYKDGALRFIEVKPSPMRGLRPDQQLLKDLFKQNLGIDIEVLSPAGPCVGGQANVTKRDHWRREATEIITIIKSSKRLTQWERDRIAEWELPSKLISQKMLFALRDMRDRVM